MKRMVLPIPVESIESPGGGLASGVEAIRCDPHFGRSVRDTERVSEGEKGNAKES